MEEERKQQEEDLFEAARFALPLDGYHYIVIIGSKLSFCLLAIGLKHCMF